MHASFKGPGGHQNEAANSRAKCGRVKRTCPPCWFSKVRATSPVGRVATERQLFAELRHLLFNLTDGQDVSVGGGGGGGGVNPLMTLEILVCLSSNTFNDSNIPIRAITQRG